MTTRRSFLKFLAGTTAAAFLPILALEENAAAVESLPMADIMAGKAHYFISLGNINDIGAVPICDRVAIKFLDGVGADEVTFPTITRTGQVTHVFVEDSEGARIGDPIPIYRSNGGATLCSGDTIHLNYSITLG